MSGRRNKGGGGGHGGGGEERWLLPYADMITLLLGLFIVLFAMSSIDAKQFDGLRSSLSQTFDGGQLLTEPGQVLPGSSGVGSPTTTSDAPSRQQIQRLQDSNARTEKQYEQQAKEIKAVAEQAGLGNDLKVSNNQRGVVVNLAGDALFESGSAQLRPGIKAKLTRLERQLEQFGRHIEIAGHTDGVPLGTSAGNWDLSADRATAVLKFFLAKGYPGELMTPTFHADTRPAVKPPKNDPYKAIAANRRIEITILMPGAKDPRSADAKLVDAATPDFAPGPAKPNPLGRHLSEGSPIVDELAAATRELQ